MISEIKAHLAAVTALKLIGGAVQFQTAAESNPAATPCAFVIPLEETPTPSEVEGIVIQRVVAAVGIVLVVRNVSDPKGEAAHVDLELLRKDVKDLLLGWQPTDALEPLERGHSGLLAFRNGHMWWQDIYLTAYYDRSVL